MKKRILSLLSILILLLMLFMPLSGCHLQDGSNQVQDSFDVFLNDLFIQEVQEDALSLKYSLAYPENYGITDFDNTLGEYSISSMNQELTQTENYLSRLSVYDYSLLTADQQLTYDIINNYLKLDLTFGNYTYYNECLGPTTGIQAQLPILLAEYTFYDKQDIEEYIDLLPCIYDYFEDIVNFEKEKSNRGLFMRDEVADRIIGQCETFISNPSENFLITYFNDKVSSFSGLTREEVSRYEALNQEAVITYVIPAYKMLIRALTDLKGTGINRAGLYYYPEGQSYYECLSRYKTGSGKTMEQMIHLLEQAIENGIITMSTLTALDTSIIDQYDSFHSFPITDPNEIMKDLKKDIAKDFPDTVEVNCNIKYVPDSLSEYLSPAMYLVPPIDNYHDNQIYINGSDEKTLSTIYTTVAHEGYPGHLYQCVYFRSSNPAPIRNLLDFLGYDEGWATYVEMYSYHISGINEALATFMEANNTVILCMYARSDIGIHYEGWTKETAINYINRFVGNTDISISIYDTLLEEPAIYLPYAVGYLEMKELKEKAIQTLGDSFSAKEFHRFLLDIGPAPFPVIEDYMEVWLSSFM